MTPLSRGAIVALVAVLARLPALVEPLAMDQALFAVIARGLSRGDRLYVDLWDHKPPAIYLLYAAIQRVLGPGAWGIALASIASQTLTALLVTKIGSRVIGSGIGLVAGLAYALFAHPILLGGFYATGQAEVFLEPLLLGSILLALRAAPRAAGEAEPDGPGRSSMLSGALLGLAALFKPTALLFAPAAFLAGRGGLRPVRYVAGLAIPAAAAALYVAASGTLGPAWDAIVGWNASSYARSPLPPSLVSTPAGVLSLLLDGILHQGPLLLVALAGALLSRGRGPVLAMFAAAVLGVVAQGKLYRYQYQLHLAPIALFTALGLGRIDAALAAPLGRARRPLLAAASVLLALPFLGTVGTYFSAHPPALALGGAEDRRRLLETYVWSSTGMRYGDTARAADFVRGASTPQETIYLLGFDPALYLLAERAPGGRYLAPDHLRFPGAEARLVADLSERRPRWTLVATDQVGPADFPAVTDWIAENAEKRAEIGRFALFERVR